MSVAGTLNECLQVPSPEAHSAPFTLGDSVYLDMTGKDSTNCHAYLSNNAGLLFLCEPAENPSGEPTHAGYNVQKDRHAPKGRCDVQSSRLQYDEMWVRYLLMVKTD